MSDTQTELPKAVVKRIIKEKLSTTGPSGEHKDVTIQKDALLAVSESAKVFLSYLTTTANDICKEHKRQTISADDVLKALEDLEFQELIEPLKEALEAYKQSNKEKNKKKAEAASKKRKAAEEAGQQAGEGAATEEAGGTAAAAPEAGAEGNKDIEAEDGGRDQGGAEDADMAEAAEPAAAPSAAGAAEGDKEEIATADAVDAS